MRYAIERYCKEAGRLDAVLNRQLGVMAELGHDLVAGAYSVADIACYPWIVPHERQRQKLEDFPHLARWFARIKSRQSTERAYARAEEISKVSVMDEAAKRVMFGQDSTAVR